MLDNQGFLKLKADDKNDLKVFAAYLQDSITTPKEIKFLEKNKAFICIFNRFMWEDAEKGIFRDNKRIRSALKIDDVRSVKSKNLNPQEEKALEQTASSSFSAFSGVNTQAYNSPAASGDLRGGNAILLLFL